MRVWGLATKSRRDRRIKDRRNRRDWSDRRGKIGNDRRRIKNEV